MDNNKYDYFMKRTEEDLDYIKVRLDKLWDFRLLLLGGSFVVSGLCSALVSVAYIYFGVH